MEQYHQKRKWQKMLLFWLAAEPELEERHKNWSKGFNLLNLIIYFGLFKHEKNLVKN